MVLLFKFQNLTSVTISSLGMSVTLFPLSVLVIFVYVLGMVTGAPSLAWFGVGSRGDAAAALIEATGSFAAGSLTSPEARSQHGIHWGPDQNLLVIIKNGQIFEISVDRRRDTVPGAS